MAWGAGGGGSMGADPVDPGSDGFGGVDVGSGGRVLVCDDTDQIRQLIRVNLELEGYEVVEASDGQAALEILQDPSNPLPDVITVDALMPRRDGWWTVSMIRADPRLEHIPIVMVTASVQEHHRAQAEQAAVDGFIAKPFEPDELVALIGILAVGGRV
ncbi:MAG TPA: response regulator [Dermatophilaceae bacterium]|nr:response regulator [Dermatophilaceae bacterium]